MLRLIRRYLEAGLMADGVVIERYEGTPQGGPLSPLLANVLLDEVDRELERTGHRFVRYADDCNVYVRSEKAGARVMTRLVKLYGKLRLKINPEKSAVAPVFERKFLGFSFRIDSTGKVRRKVAKQALQSLKTKVKAIARRNGGRARPLRREPRASLAREDARAALRLARLDPRAARWAAAPGARPAHRRARRRLPRRPLRGRRSAGRQRRDLQSLVSAPPLKISRRLRGRRPSGRGLARRSAAER